MVTYTKVYARWNLSRSAVTESEYLTDRITLEKKTFTFLTSVIINFSIDQSVFDSFTNAIEQAP